MKFAAVIFDLDGTILANEDEYGESFAKVLKSLGVEVNSNYPQISGIGVKENWQIFLKKYNLKTAKSIEQLTQETQDIYLSKLSTVRLRKGFEEFINDLKKIGVLTALATSNVGFIVDKVLKSKNLKAYFDVITTAEEVRFTKPDPDLFLETAVKLGVEPAVCLVIEDAKAGITAAHRAGMKVVGIARDEDYKGQLKKADLVVNDFTELSSEILMQL